MKVIFGGLDSGNIHFHFDDVGIDAIDGSAHGLVEHGILVGVDSRLTLHSKPHFANAVVTDEQPQCDR